MTTEVPFDFNIETTTWTFENGDHVTVEKNASGYLISGNFSGVDWHDEDHEDFFCADTDEFLSFLETHGLLRILSMKPS